MVVFREWGFSDTGSPVVHYGKLFYRMNRFLSMDLLFARFIWLSRDTREHPIQFLGKVRPEVTSA